MAKRDYLAPAALRKKTSRRLRELVDQKGSVRQFHKAMYKAMGGVAGTGASYANITRYLNGDLDPSYVLLVHAAQYFNVDVRYLLGTRDSAGPEDAAIRTSPATKAMVEEIQQRIEREIARTFPAYGARWSPQHPTLGPHLSPSTKSTVWGTLGRLRGQRALEGGDHSAVAVAKALGRALHQPLKALGVDPSDLTPWELDSYVTGLCAALAPLTARSGLRRSTFGERDAAFEKPGELVAVKKRRAR